MSIKRIVLRDAADQDVLEAGEYYLNEATAQVAEAFMDELARAFKHIGRYPASGSPRYAHELGIPGLRFWPVKRFPYLVFYVAEETDIEVWRVLHEHRDIPAWLTKREEND